MAPWPHSEPDPFSCTGNVLLMGLVETQGEHPDLTTGTSHSQNLCGNKFGVSHRDVLLGEKKQPVHACWDTSSRLPEDTLPRVGQPAHCGELREGQF